MGFKANRPVETSLKTFEIIERLREDGATGITQLATELDVSKGIIHNHLSTLRQIGYVVKIDDKYVLSSKALRLGQSVREDFPVFQHGTDAADLLAIESKTRVTLIGREAQMGIILYDIGTQLVKNTEYNVGSILEPGMSPLTGLLLDQHERAEQYSKYTIEHVGETTRNRPMLLGKSSAHDMFAGVAAPIYDMDQNPVGVIATHQNIKKATRTTQEIITPTLNAAEQIETQLAVDWETSRTFATIKHNRLK